jgi:hypothetical protein
MLSEEFKTAIITGGMQFMRTITEAYGAEKGMALWDTIASTLDPEVKCQIFFAMITGQYDSKLHVSYNHVTPRQSVNAVAAIKAIRTVTGCGPNEAKDMWDNMRDTGQRIVLTVNPDKLKTARTELINSGLTVA